MAMTSQFSLGLEVSRFIPPVINMTSKAMLQLVRDIRNSGSDLITEHDLAAVLGRNTVNVQFANNFKNATRASAVHRLSGIVELVLEAGAGPTVKHGVDNAPFFSMIVQLSLLSWAHSMPDLAEGLAKALEARNTDGLANVPRVDALLGTIRCCREQTSGFFWELLFAAVEAKLKKHVTSARNITYDVLQTLLGGFATLQHNSQVNFLDVNTSHGVSTVVIWAHHVLGFTVEVIAKDDVVKFGNGAAQVSINTMEPDRNEVTLFNQTRELFGASLDGLDDPPLSASRRHPIHGFGNSLLDIETPAFVCHTVNEVLIMAEAQRASNLGLRGDNFLPSRSRIISTSEILFPGVSITPDSLTNCPDDSPKYWTRNLKPALRRLIMAFSMVNNLEECKEAPMCTDKSFHSLDKASPISADAFLSPSSAFRILALMLSGDQNLGYKEAVVISSWGWSLCISSIMKTDPGELHPDFVIIRGVPSRYGERKLGIYDHTASRVAFDDYNVANPNYKVVGRAGEHVSLRSFMNTTPTKFMVGVTETCFRVFSTFMIGDESRKSAAYFRLGFRRMQELYWSTCHLPAIDCCHSFIPGDAFSIPPNAWVCEGLFWDVRFKHLEIPGASLNEKDSSLSQADYNHLRPESISGQKITRAEAPMQLHISQTAGSSSARWIVMGGASCSTRNDSRKDAVFDAVFLRDDDCCVDCAVAFIIAHMAAFPAVRHVGLIA